MFLKLRKIKSIQYTQFRAKRGFVFRLSLISAIIYIGGQFVGCQSRVHERDFQTGSTGRDIKNEIKASGLANKRLEDAQKFLSRIKDITEKLKDSVPVETNTDLLDDMTSAIDQASRSLYQFENESVLFAGELELRNPQAGQTDSKTCVQHQFSIRYNVPDDKLEISIIHCDGPVQKAVLSSRASEVKFRIAVEKTAIEPVEGQNNASKMAFTCESTAIQQMNCQNIALGSGSDSQWLLDFSREGVATHIKVTEIEDEGGAIRTRMGFTIDSDGVVRKDQASSEPPKDSQP